MQTDTNKPGDDDNARPFFLFLLVRTLRCNCTAQPLATLLHSHLLQRTDVAFPGPPNPSMHTHTQTLFVSSHNDPAQLFPLFFPLLPRGPAYTGQAWDKLSRQVFFLKKKKENKSQIAFCYHDSNTIFVRQNNVFCLRHGVKNRKEKNIYMYIAGETKNVVLSQVKMNVNK